MFKDRILTRRRHLLAAFALAGLLAAMAVLVALGRPQPQTVGIVSLRRSVPAGSVLTPDDLTLVQIPASLADPAYLAAIHEAVGQAPVHGLRVGQLLERGWLRDRPMGIAYPDAAADARLYTLRLQPEQANGFWLAAGNRVDVHLVARGDSTVRNDYPLPEMLPAIRIAALIGDTDDPGASLQSMTGNPSDKLMVCLAVNAAEARILALAEATSTIKLVPLNEPPPGADLDTGLDAGLDTGLDNGPAEKYGKNPA